MRSKKSSAAKESIWQFTSPSDRNGHFTVPAPDATSGLFFPLANGGGMMSAITPSLKGDIKTGQNSFLTLPVVTEELHNISTGRNFWIRTDKGEVWSAVGESADFVLRRAQSENPDEAVVQVQPGVFEVTRRNEKIGLESKITAFVPSSGEKVEINIVTIKNTSSSPVSFTPTAAIPIYGRSADNLRDHRQVTTMLNRVTFDAYGVLNKPTMSFDERGHKENKLIYCVLGADGEGKAADEMWGDLNKFIGEGGSLYAPATVYNEEAKAPAQKPISGREAIGALRFAKVKLGAGKEVSFIILMGVASAPEELRAWKKKFLTLENALKSKEETAQWWHKTSRAINFQTGDENFDNWMVWVTTQPIYRKIFGCSFLPEFGYGRGGRGWRDLWQDCLALLLTQPDEARSLLFNNYAGVRVDGSNATIIGSGPGEFIADRNNIPRTWMDHGVWPLITTALYIEQSGDIDILLMEQKYFKDVQAFRCRKKDDQWSSADGTWLKDSTGRVYSGTILEHLIIQNITQFFNVGTHGNVKLEGADWNDGLDMAARNGESVTFSAMYASNLERLAELIDRLKEKGQDEFELAEEISVLFDTLPCSSPVEYASVEERNFRLDLYMQKVAHNISGRKMKLKGAEISSDLLKKAAYLKDHIAKHEFISAKDGSKFFNGYYNNDSQRVEGDHPMGLRMTLTGQVFPVMSGVASNEQVGDCIEAVKRHLKDPKLGGYRLNTDFKELQLNFGRAFSFSYGDKENGAFFSHMAVMWMFGLYSRGFVSDGYEVLSAIYNMCVNSGQSKIFPGIPEYFNSEGRGRYHYLTGSASWMLYSVLTQVFGVRGLNGNLLLYPKLMGEQFDENGHAAANTRFAGVSMSVIYANSHKLDCGQYLVSSVTINGKGAPFYSVQGGKGAMIDRKTVISSGKNIEIKVILNRA